MNLLENRIKIIMSSVVLLKPPVKSANDKKSYRLIRLENGLKALLISVLGDEPESNSTEETNDSPAACALSIDVGTFSDPFEIQGLAHFLGMFHLKTSFDA